MATRTSPSRPAFTLIEMLVTLAIMLTTFTMSVAFLAAAYQKQGANATARQVQNWLVTSRERAKRDMLPSGVRLIVDSNNNVTRAQYLQKPVDFTGGTMSVASGSTTVQFTGVTLTGKVFPGDYLDLNGIGPPHRITDVSATSVTLFTQSGTSPFPYAIPATSNYRILRQAQPIAGEPTLTLTDKGIIDITNSRNLGTNAAPVLTTANGITYLDLVFAPSGELLVSSQNLNTLVLWVRDSTTSNPNLNGPVLVSVTGQTGFTCTHPVDTTLNGDPYSFTKLSRSSGL